MEQLQGQIRIREQVNENLRGKIDSLGFQLSLLSNQNRELMMKNPEEEVARKTEQLQLQLDSMMMVVNKLEQSKNRLED